MTTPAELLSLYSSQSQVSSFFADYMGIVSIKSFGAVGDGVTNDTVAVQNCIDFITEKGLKSIFFPHGTYKVDSSLSSVFTNIFLWGDNSSFSGINVTINQVGVNLVAFNKLFTGLQDAPQSYVGKGGYIVAVKTDASGLEFINTILTQAVLDVHKSSSDHDGRYFTETEIATILADYLTTVNAALNYYNKTQIAAKLDMTKGAPKSIAGVDNAAGDISVVGGTGITVSIDNTTKIITITATGTATPGAHASSHASAGSDPISAASIGAETPTGAQAKADAVQTNLTSHQAEKASDTVLGHVKKGNGVNIDTNGVISIASTWEKIAESALGSNQSQIDFTSIDTGWKALKLIFYSRSSAASVSDLWIRINDNVGSNYINVRNELSTSANTPGGSTDTKIVLPKALNRYADNSPAYGEINFNNNSSAGLTAGYTFMHHANNAGPELLEIGGGTLNFYGKITKISLIPSANLIGDGSVFTLMGVK